MDYTWRDYLDKERKEALDAWYALGGKEVLPYIIILTMETFRYLPIKYESNKTSKTLFSIKLWLEGKISEELIYYFDYYRILRNQFSHDILEVKLINLDSDDLEEDLALVNNTLDSIVGCLVREGYM